MSNIYCTSCGTKNVLGAKFCFNCGNQIGSQALMNNSKMIRQAPSKRNVEYDEEGIPTTFVKPQKLNYEIEKSKNRFSVSEILSVPPSPDHIMPKGDPNIKIPSKEEFLKQSLSECRSTRNPQDIDET